MALLAPPYNLLTPLSGMTISLEITASVDGTIMVTDSTTGEVIEVGATRFFGRRLDRYCSNAYWDCSSKRLQAMLSAFLTSGLLIGKSVTLRSTGTGSMKKDSVQIAPIPL